MHDPMKPTVIRGVLGGEKALGDNRGYGDLLGDALDREGESEGADLIVVAVSRSMLRSDPDAADKIELAVLAALVDLGEKP